MAAVNVVRLFDAWRAQQWLLIDLQFELFLLTHDNAFCMILCVFAFFCMGRWCSWLSLLSNTQAVLSSNLGRLIFFLLFFIDALGLHALYLYAE